MLTNAFRSLSLLSLVALLAHGAGCAAPVSDAPEEGTRETTDEGSSEVGDEHTGEASDADIFNRVGPGASPTACVDLGTGHGWCQCGQPDNTCYNVNCHGAWLSCSGETGLCFCSW